MSMLRTDRVTRGRAPYRSSRCNVALAVAALALAASPTLSAQAQQAHSPPATVEAPMRDPWVPPELRKPAAVAAPQGAALRARVERKLKASFDAADVNRSGTVTREQARAAGLGYIVKHFDEIDLQRAGAVSFEDVKRYLRSKGAQLD
jgi:hypothetical protein